MVAGTPVPTMARISDTSDCDVLVIGGGIAGCATGHYLAAAGVDVVVVERFDLNTQASGRNAGSLHGQIQHEPFVTLGEQWARSFLPALRFLVDSIALWRGLSAELGVDLEVKTPGGILVAETRAQLADIARKVAIEQDAGMDVELLDAARLHELAPYVSERMIGGELARSEGKANSLLAAPALAASVTARGGRVLTNTRVLSVERVAAGFEVRTSAGTLRCGRVVAATGFDLPELLGGVAPGFASLPITAEPVQVNVTEPVAPLVEHLLYFAGERLTMKQTRSGSLLIGGGWPATRDAAGRPVVNVESLRANLNVAISVVPAVSNAFLLRSWVGVGNGTPDHRPIIGCVPGVKGLFAGMFPYMGLTAGPLTGRVLADLVLGQDTGYDLSPFDISRF